MLHNFTGNPRKDETAIIPGDNILLVIGVSEYTLAESGSTSVNNAPKYNTIGIYMFCLHLTTSSFSPRLIPYSPSSQLYFKDGRLL